MIKNIKNIKITERDAEYIDIEFSYQDDLDLNWNGEARLEIEWSNKKGEYVFRVLEASSKEDKEIIDGEIIPIEFTDSENETLLEAVELELSNLLNEAEENDNENNLQNQDYYNSVM